MYFLGRFLSFEVSHLLPPYEAVDAQVAQGGGEVEHDEDRAEEDPRLPVVLPALLHRGQRASRRLHACAEDDEGLDQGQVGAADGGARRHGAQGQRHAGAGGGEEATRS